MILIILGMILATLIALCLVAKNEIATFEVAKNNKMLKSGIYKRPVGLFLNGYPLYFDVETVEVSETLLHATRYNDLKRLLNHHNIEYIKIFNCLRIVNNGIVHIYYPMRALDYFKLKICHKEAIPM